MNRLILIFAGLAVLAGPLVPGGVAAAKDHDRGERGSDRGDRGGYERRGDEPGLARGRGGPNGRDDRGGSDRGAYERGERRGYEADDRPQYAPSPRRGGYMPPEAGGPLPDYGRYRLRPPPRGFVWVRTGNGFAMVSEQTGQVFDVVPN